MMAVTVTGVRDFGVGAKRHQLLTAVSGAGRTYQLHSYLATDLRPYVGQRIGVEATGFVLSKVELG